MTGVLGAYGSETGIWLHLLYPLAAGRVNRLDAKPGEARRRIDGWREVALLIQKLECDTKSRNVLRVNAALSIWSNPTVTCTGQKPALGSSQDNMGNLPA